MKLIKIVLAISILTNCILYAGFKELKRENESIKEFNKNLEKTNGELYNKYFFEKMQAEFYFNLKKGDCDGSF